MKKWKPPRTEFYESAVQMGFYGNEESSLTGKKDNVRKFWEDVYMKLVCRPHIENFSLDKKKIRVLDLGSGSGEGFELLTHIPPSNPGTNVHRDFILKPSEIECYVGIDISPSMVTQGRINYRHAGNVFFEEANLEKGLPDFITIGKPFNLYFSSYGSLSHLSPDTMENLCKEIFEHAENGSLFIFDTHGKYSPSWPKYWSEEKVMLPYSMGYLDRGDPANQYKFEWFDICYWDPLRLKETLKRAAYKARCEININVMLDRSIFVGRHIDTGILGAKRIPLRYQVNRLLDHGYRGEVEHLKIDVSHLEPYSKVNPNAWERITDYQRKWNRVIYLLEALMKKEDSKVRNFIENTNIDLMSDELKFLTWLFRNADRFPVVDYWASIIGPQVAVVLRNLELSYSDGVGCGHGLVCAVEILK